MTLPRWFGRKTKKKHINENEKSQEKECNLPNINPEYHSSILHQSENKPNEISKTNIAAANLLKSNRECSKYGGEQQQRKKVKNLMGSSIEHYHHRNDRNNLDFSGEELSVVQPDYNSPVLNTPIHGGRYFKRLILFRALDTYYKKRDFLYSDTYGNQCNFR